MSERAVRFRRCLILIARPELTTMAKKLKARDNIGKKEREIFSKF